jgi:hypothetical protein
MPNDTESSDERFAADLLRGAPKIAAFLKELGWGKGEPDEPYYAHRVKSWPIGKIGKNLVASKTALARHARRVTSV